MRDIELVKQTDFFESWQMPTDDFSEVSESETPEIETSEVSSACVTKKDEDNLDDAWLLEGYKPGNLQKEFAKIQPTGTLRVGGIRDEGLRDLASDEILDAVEESVGHPSRRVQRKVGKGEPDTILILKDRLPGDFTEDDDVQELPAVKIAVVDEDEDKHIHCEIV